MNRYNGMFFCDVDGTILPHGQREVSPSFFSLVHEAKERGFLFCISSGRFHLSLIPLFEQVEDEVVFSASNGCRILYQGRELIPNHTIMFRMQSKSRNPCSSKGRFLCFPARTPFISHCFRSSKSRTKGYLAKGLHQDI